MRITIDNDTSKKYKKYKKKYKKRYVKKTKSVAYEHGLDSPVKKSDYNFSAYGKRMTGY